ncbi:MULTISPECIES: GHKL domain-containing protein [Dehalobacter]|jgi:two-component system sensor histidine kinase AgrC|uniref:Histidine kinase n=1 Tax=Dehalobacter restrictus (strain DSM 9455 / PER-K23) TaxID=871738 RepID=A0ABM5P514_DEHRP|nr:MULTISPECIES: GHKL domain-containing protein [Dehalobacter]AHF09636.1 histidine kinase [Dehalobacter restrictus DSM 9455]MCG1026534.1 GHKL domain-containing protein [Dehalobacter sp.]MDJ0304323.1 GHKL domain-containing protein [Dehalobacter sp.]OCZ54975.1 histidine kinase [Dehalobacter sp. TeCB1]
MKINIYKISIFVFVIQALFTVILLNNGYMKSYSFLQPVHAELLELIFGFIIILLNLVAVVVVKSLYMKGLEDEKLKSTEIKYANLIEQNRIYRQHHHDLKNHLTVIHGLLSLEKYTELSEYLDSYIHSINDVLLKVDTGVDEMDILFTSEIQEAKHKNIEVNLVLKTKIKCSKRHVLDLVGILGNLFNNAIEAVQELDLSSRKISIIFYQDPLEYTFQFINPMSATNANSDRLFVKEGFSTKGEDRGQGLAIVSKLVERLDGSINIDTANHQFRIMVEIPKHNLEEG